MRENKNSFIQIIRKSAWINLSFIPAFILLVLDQTKILNLDSMRTLIFAEQNFYFSCLFNVPHLFASGLILMQRDYIRFFKWRIALGGLLIGGYLYLAWRWQNHFFLQLFFLLLVAKHVNGQVFKLSMMCLEKSRFNQWWYYSCLIFSLVLYLAYFAQKMPFLLVYFSTILGSRFEWLESGVKVLLVGTGLVMSGISIGMAMQKGQTFKSRLPLLLSALYPGVCYLFYSCDLLILIFANVRIFHDAQAFLIYYEHNKRAFKKEGREEKISFDSSLRMSQIIVFAYTFCLPVALAIFFNTLFVQYQFYSWYIAISLFHFYSESFTWKMNSPYRKYFHVG